MFEKRALVCGASQGIGQATAFELARLGLAVTLFARNENRLKEILEKLPGEGHDFISGDILEREFWQKELTQRHTQNPYSIVVLNSGGPKGGAISKALPEEFTKAMEKHLVANSVMVRLFLEHMKQKRFGRILTVTSTSVKIPIPHLGVSNTVRSAVASWAKTLSLELAPCGITVNNVMPGFTNTPRLKSLIQAQADSLNKSYEVVEQSWKEKVPMGRFAEPAETASLIGFLVSEKASYITGQSIAVDGGRLGCL